MGFFFCLLNTDFGQTLEQPQGAWLNSVPTIFVLINNLKIQCIPSTVNTSFNVQGSELLGHAVVLVKMFMNHS